MLADIRVRGSIDMLIDLMEIYVTQLQLQNIFNSVNVYNNPAYDRHQWRQARDSVFQRCAIFLHIKRVLIQLR